METCCDYLDHDLMYVSTDEPKIKRKIMQYNEEYPDKVTILKEPDQNQGTLYCTVPPNWLKITPPRKINYSEEQKAAWGQSMKEKNAQRLLHKEGG